MRVEQFGLHAERFKAGIPLRKQRRLRRARASYTQPAKGSSGPVSGFLRAFLPLQVTE